MAIPVSDHYLLSFQFYNVHECACTLNWVWLFAMSRTVVHQAPFPWNSPDKNTGVGSHSLLQGIFLTQGWQVDFFHFATWEAPFYYNWPLTSQTSICWLLIFPTLCILRFYSFTSIFFFFADTLNSFAMLFFYTLNVDQLWVLAKRSHQAILKEIKPVYSLEGIFLPIFLLKEGMFKLWPPDVKSWLTGKDPGKTGKDAGKDWRQKKGAAQDEILKTVLSTQWTWIWANSGSSGQRSLACYSPCGHKESDMT